MMKEKLTKKELTGEDGNSCAEILLIESLKQTKSQSETPRDGIKQIKTSVLYTAITIRKPCKTLCKVLKMLMY